MKNILILFILPLVCVLSVVQAYADDNSQEITQVDSIDYTSSESVSGVNFVTDEIKKFISLSEESDYSLNVNADFLEHVAKTSFAANVHKNELTPISEYNPLRNTVSTRHIRKENRDEGGNAGGGGGAGTSSSGFGGGTGSPTGSNPDSTTNNGSDLPLLIYLPPEHHSVLIPSVTPNPSPNHISYTSTSAAIPEPEQYALLLVGIPVAIRAALRKKV